MAFVGQLSRSRNLTGTATAVGLVLGVLSWTGPALADFPGERWNVPYVQVTGSNQSEMGPITVGLNAANNTYFYGDRNTKMQAVVRGQGTMDLRIIDQSNGQVIAEQRGLKYSGTGAAVSESVAAAALRWMDSLNCADGCRVATSGAAPTVQVAQAAPTPEPTPEPVVVEPVKTPSAPTESIVAAEARPALSQPKAAVPAKAEPSLAASSLPTTGSVETQPLITAPTPEPAQAPKPAKPEAETVIASVPSTGGSTEAPSVATASVAEPSTGTAATPSGSLLAGLLPDTGTTESDAPEISEPTLNEPSIPQPAAQRPASTGGTSAPRVPSGAQDADQVLAALDRQQQEPQVQNVLPGVTLPPPRPGNVSPLAESLGASPSAPEQVEAETTVALSEPSTTAIVPSQSTRDGVLDDGGSVAVGDADQGTVAAPAPTTIEPARAADPVAVAAAPSAAESPAAPVTGEETPFLSPTPVARVPQEAALPTAPTAEVAVATPTIGDAADTKPAAPAAPSEPTRPTAVAQDPEPTTTEPQPAQATPAEPTVITQAPAAADDGALTEDSLDGEQVALANPTQPVNRPTAAQPEQQPVPEPTPELQQPEAQEQPAEDLTGQEASTSEASSDEETQVASVDPTATGPTLANARWVGFTPAVYAGSDDKSGAWIAGPFDRKQRTGWITDTATGATTRVTFVWKEAGQGGRTAVLSREAAKALGLGQGDVANVAVYLPR